ncbi:D-2-hydroxyacid dehydrogenase [Streptomyces sanglieri]
MTQPNIVLLHRFPPENNGDVGLLKDKLSENLPDVDIERCTDYADSKKKITDAKIVVEHRIDDELLEEATELEWIQSLSSGYDRFDLKSLSEDDIVLTTVSGVHADPIAQHVLGYVLAFERGHHRAWRQKQRREWRRFTPGDLTGKTIGVVGVGSIGSRICELFDAVGATVLGVKRDLDSVPHGIDEIYSPERLHTVLNRSNYVVASCPLTPETRELFDKRAFASMGSDSIFVNVSRGEVVDEDALVDALSTGMLGGAALDVTTDEPLPKESPLWDFENVLITPHLAGGSGKFAERCADIISTNYERFVNGQQEYMTNRVV